MPSSWQPSHECQVHPFSLPESCPQENPHRKQRIASRTKGHQSRAQPKHATGEKQKKQHDLHNSKSNQTSTWNKQKQSKTKKKVETTKKQQCWQKPFAQNNSKRPSCASFKTFPDPAAGVEAARFPPGPAFFNTGCTSGALLSLASASGRVGRSGSWATRTPRLWGARCWDGYLNTFIRHPSVGGPGNHPFQKCGSHKNEKGKWSFSNWRFR